MDGVRKELVIAGIVGGVTSLFMAAVVRRFMWKRHNRGGKRGASELLTMLSDKMPAPVGPYCFGKTIKMPNGSLYGYSSGQLGLDP
jgi:hypothetical protein